MWASVCSGHGQRGREGADWAAGRHRDQGARPTGRVMETRMNDEQQRITAGPGTFVLGPREIPHGFRVAGSSPARMSDLPRPGAACRRLAMAWGLGWGWSCPLLLTPAFVWSPRLRGARGETDQDGGVVRRLFYVPARGGRKAIGLDNVLQSLLTTVVR
jgi:hypothetical protein